MKRYFFFLTLTILAFACGNRTKERTITKEPILLADREAPLGWVYLRIYEDRTFEFESRGLERTGTVYPGTIELFGDTILFHYADSIPSAGDRAIITSNTVSYFAGKYRESVEIKLNKLR